MKPNVIRPLGGIVISIVIGIGAFVFGPNIINNEGPPPTGGSLTAHLWVVPANSGGTCIRQATPLVISTTPDSATCSTMAQACAAASAGDTIRVQNGQYPSQTLGTTCGGTSGSRKTIDAQNGSEACNRQMIQFVSTTLYTHNDCPVSISGDLTVSGHDLNINNMSIDGSLDFPPSTSGSQARVTATNIHSKIFGLTGDTITIQDGEAGGFYVCNQPVSVDTPMPQDAGHVGFAPGGTVNNITIDGYIIHDLYDISGGQPLCGTTFTNPPHADCLQIAQGTNVTVKNSQFWNCATSDIQSNADWTPYGTISYVNNFFGHMYDQGNAAEIGTSTGVQADDCTGTNTIAYNTFAATALEQVCGTTGTFVIEGNIFLPGIDVSGLVGAGASNTTEYNVFQSGAPGSPIGTNSKVCAPNFTGTNDQVDGLHLDPADVCATGAGKPGTTVVTTDIDGDARPATPDAGADEIVGSGGGGGGTSATPIFNGDTYTINTSGTTAQGGQGTLPPYQWSSTWMEGIGFTKHTDSNPNAHGVAMVPDPNLNLNRNVIKVTTDNSINNSCCFSNSYTRSEIRGPRLFGPGMVRWLVAEIWIPTSTPVLQPGFWWTIWSCYGSPYRGASPISLGGDRNSTGTGNNITFKTPAGAVLWQTPMVEGAWHILARKISFATDSTNGYMEIYHSMRDAAGNPTGPLVQQTIQGQLRYHMITLGAANWDGTEFNHSDVKNYHKSPQTGWTGLTSLYFARHRVYDGAVPISQIDPFSTGLR